METKKVNMPKTLDTQVDGIHIGMLSNFEYGKIVIQDSAEIERILTLINAAEECPDYVHSPSFVGFRVELYQCSKLVARIGVADDYFHRADEWHYMQGLGKELYEVYGKHLFDK